MGPARKLAFIATRCMRTQTGMVESVECRFGLVDKLPKSIEWLSDNGSPYTATDTRALARYIGLVPCTTRIASWLLGRRLPQTRDGMSSPVTQE